MYGILTVKPVKVNLKCLTLCSNSFRSYGKNNSTNRLFGSVFNDNNNYQRKGTVVWVWLMKYLLPIRCIYWNLHTGSFTVGLNMFNIGVIRPHFSSTNEGISSVLKKTKPKRRKQYNSRMTTNITEGILYNDCFTKWFFQFSYVS